MDKGSNIEITSPLSSIYQIQIPRISINYKLKSKSSGGEQLATSSKKQTSMAEPLMEMISEESSWENTESK